MSTAIGATHIGADKARVYHLVNPEVFKRVKLEFNNSNMAVEIATGNMKITSIDGLNVIEHLFLGKDLTTAP